MDVATRTVLMLLSSCVTQFCTGGNKQVKLRHHGRRRPPCEAGRREHTTRPPLRTLRLVRVSQRQRWGGQAVLATARFMAGDHERESPSETTVLVPERLEGVVQDVHSHQEFVLLNILHVHLVGYNFLPRWEVLDCATPLVLGQRGVGVPPFLRAGEKRGAIRAACPERAVLSATGSSSGHRANPQTVNFAAPTRVTRDFAREHRGVDIRPLTRPIASRRRCARSSVWLLPPGAEATQNCKVARATGQGRPPC